MTDKTKNKLLWTVAIVALFLAFMAYTKISYGAWTITQDRIGTYSSELTVVTSATDVLRTNYIRSAGLMNCKVIPLQYYIVIQSNFLGAAYTGLTGVGCYPLNSTNLLIFRPTGPTAATYIRFKIILNKPHNSIK